MIEPEHGAAQHWLAASNRETPFLLLDLDQGSSVQGQSRRLAPPLTTSGLPPTADIKHRDHHFRKMPQADLGQGKGRSKRPSRINATSLQLVGTSLVIAVLKRSLFDDWERPQWLYRGAYDHPIVFPSPPNCLSGYLSFCS